MHAGAFVFANASYKSDTPLELGAVPLKVLEDFVGRRLVGEGTKIVFTHAYQYAAIVKCSNS